MTDHLSMEEFLDGIDWTALRDQKAALLAVIANYEYAAEDDPEGWHAGQATLLTGILHLIDALQDEADRHGLVPEGGWLTEGE